MRKKNRIVLKAVRAATIGSRLAALLLPVYLNASTAPPASPLTQVADVRGLSREQARTSRPVRLTGVVTALSGWRNSFFVQDNTAGISVDRLQSTPAVQPGDTVEISGTSGPGMFAPLVMAREVRVIGRGKMPEAPLFEVAQLKSGVEDSQRLSVRGVVRSAEVRPIWGRDVLVLQLETATGMIAARVLSFSGNNFAYLVDSEVRVSGVCGTNFNDHRQILGVRLFVPDMAGIKVELPAAADPFSAPLRDIGTLLRFGQQQAPNHRVRLRGTVTYQRLGEQLYLQEGDRAIAVHSRQRLELKPGMAVEAIGFAEPGSFAPILADANFRRVPGETVLRPVPIEAGRMILQAGGFRTAPQNGLLVSIRAKLLERIERTHEQTLLLRGGNTPFTANLDLRSGGTIAGSAVQAEPGSIVEVTGICSVQPEGNDDESATFSVLMRSAADIRILKAPGWWHMERIAYLLAATLGILTLLCVTAVAEYRSRLQRQRDLLTNWERVFRSTLENIPLLAIGLNAEGRVTYCNKAALAVLERTGAEVVGQCWDEQFVSPTSADKETPIDLDDEPTQLQIRHENYVYPKSGGKRFISWYNTALFEMTGELHERLLIGEDVTLRRRTEEDLIRASEVASSASRSLSEFLADVSQEIGGPMNGIIGMTNLVLDTDLTAEQRENIELVKASANGLLTMINDILDFSKIRTGTSPSEQIPFNLEETIEEALRDIVVLARQKGLELVCQIAPDTPLELLGDPRPLRQLMVNLLSNSIRISGKGEITLRVEYVESVGEEVKLHFAVSDEGVGVLAEQRGSVFRAFTQTQSSFSRQSFRNGVPLAVQARLVELLNGKIWVESEPGHIRTVHLTAIMSRTPALAGALSNADARPLGRT